MTNSIEKIIDLIKKTGDKCIVLDSNGEPAFVAMRFTEYENLIENTPSISDLSEEQLLEKINHDIAIWKNNQKDQEISNLDTAESVFEEVMSDEDKVEIEDNSLNEAKKQDSSKDFEDTYYFEPIE